jgi:hypothetical protein
MTPTIPLRTIPLFFIIGAIILANIGLALVLRRYLEVTRGKAIVVWLLSLIAGVGAGLIRARQLDTFRQWTRVSEPFAPLIVCLGLLASLFVIFAAKLHSKWIVGGATEAEKKPGMQGVRAWLGAGNVICVILISLLAWLAINYSPWGVALLGLLALLAYPAMTTAAVYFQPPPPPESNAPERQRVLNMLDSGKITASECAELLGALSVSEKPRTAKAAAGPPPKLALIGVLLLLIGFFMPWFNINPQAEMSRMVGGFPTGTMSYTNAIKIAGGDIQHGLGWLILFLGVAAAAMPYLLGSLLEQTRQRATLALLGAGAFILLYLVTQNLRFVSIGIVLAVLGYGLQLAGALREGHFTGHGAD